MRRVSFHCSRLILCRVSAQLPCCTWFVHCGRCGLAQLLGHSNHPIPFQSNNQPVNQTFCPVNPHTGGGLRRYVDDDDPSYSARQTISSSMDFARAATSSIRGQPNEE